MPCAVGDILKGQRGTFGLYRLGKREWELLRQREPIPSHHVLKETRLQRSWLWPLRIK